MEGFSYNNIFETKGIEYLIIIAFLILIVPFWITINKNRLLKSSLKKVAGVLSESILRIPQGIFYSRNHTWAYLEKSGHASVGVDDFVVHATGTISISDLKHAGSFIRKGEPLALIDQGKKRLTVYSPVSGFVTETNSELLESPDLLVNDPYEKGWLYKLKPSDWKAETGTYYFAEDAIVWLRIELGRFKDFLSQSALLNSPESSALILQDGGEFCDNPLQELPEEVWQDFQKSFLN